jgi:ligand-binding sensor domain-containing protein/signal transduction histidine kinase
LQFNILQRATQEISVRGCNSVVIGWKVRLALLLVVLLLGCVTALRPASALDPSKAVTQYVHTAWRTDDGLPQTSVMKILQTRDGYLWVATQNGLGRFDGARFRTFDRTNTPSLHDNWISDLVEDRAGTLWIATSHGGLTSLHNGIFSHFGGVDERAARTLAADPDGSIWVGGTGGVAHLRDGRVAGKYRTSDGLSGDPVRRIVVDRERSVWIATAGGLDRLLGGRIRSYSIKDGLPNTNVLNLYLGSDNMVWAKTLGSELVRWAGGRFRPWKIKGVAGTAVHDMLQDHDGNLWIASSTQGLLRIHDQHVSQYTGKNGLSNDEALCLYQDRDGNLWAGTNEGGLDRFRDSNLTTYSTEEGLPADRTHSVLEDGTGNIWVTTSSGLSRLNGAGVRIFTTTDGLPTNNVLSLQIDHRKDLLIGTLNDGLVRMRAGHFVKRLTIRDGVPASPISGILEDSAHDLWLATNGSGLSRYRDGRATAYSESNGLLSNTLFAVTEGLNGTIWIGTNDGLNSIRSGKVESYLTKNGPAHATIVTLLFDSRKILWIGTLDRGLFRFENGRFTQYTVRQGLPDDTIGNILEDSAANLWIGSNKGISRLRRQDLDAVAAGTGHIVHPTVFGRADGMKTADLNTGTQPNGWRARDGRLWFPTTRGVVVVDPSHLSFNHRPPSSRIEELVADDVALDLALPVRLQPDTHRLEIRYTAPNLTSPERMLFRYRLEGFDRQWIAGGISRVADYTNLSPGHYIFHVSASVESGNWNGQEATLAFDLLPEFYQTWWFRAFCGLAVIAAAWAAYRLRVNWLHVRAAVLEERQRIAREIHDSLAQGLAGIIFQTEAALMSMTRAPALTSTHLTTARELAMSSLDDARYSVSNLSPPVDDHKGLRESLSSIARQLARGRAEEINIRSSGTAWTMGPQASHHVVLIVKEALSNAISHGKARSISIELNYTADEMLVRVSDDGCGFDQELEVQRPGRGYGMGNMQHRAQRLGSRLGVMSEIGTGTVVSLRVPRASRLMRWWSGFLGSDVARIDN